MIDISELKFDDKGLIPAIVQEDATGDVLMMAYMNRESVQKTMETGLCTFFSRSRQALWVSATKSSTTAQWCRSGSSETSTKAER